MKTLNENPVTDELISRTILLEERIISHGYDLEIIQELVMFYSKIVEFYDSIRDPITKYFMEKIQITLASRNTLKVISQKKKSEKTKKIDSINKEERSKISSKRSLSNKNPTQTDDNRKLAEFNKPQELKNNYASQPAKIQTFELSKRKEIRAKECHFNLKLEKQNTSEEKNSSVQRLIRTHSTVENQNDKIVKDSLSKQDVMLQKR